MLNHRSVPLGAYTLDAPTVADLDGLYEIYSDPLVWTHFPSLRHTTRAQTKSLLQRWIDGWRDDGLGCWIIHEQERVLGNVGCMLLAGSVWNLGYRLSPELHGRGIATAAAQQAIMAARELRPDVPVIAYLVEHNVASARVAEKVGLTLQHNAPDVGNPDPQVQRLVFADRRLTDEQLAVALS